MKKNEIEKMTISLFIGLMRKRLENKPVLVKLLHDVSFIKKDYSIESIVVEYLRFYSHDSPFLLEDGKKDRICIKWGSGVLEENEDYVWDSFLNDLRDYCINYLYQTTEDEIWKEEQL